MVYFNDHNENSWFILLLQHDQWHLRYMYVWYYSFYRKHCRLATRKDCVKHLDGGKNKDIYLYITRYHKTTFCIPYDWRLPQTSAIIILFGIWRRGPVIRPLAIVDMHATTNRKKITCHCCGRFCAQPSPTSNSLWWTSIAVYWCLIEVLLILPYSLRYPVTFASFPSHRAPKRSP